MRRLYTLAIALGIVMISFSAIRAQDDEYKWEGFAGYSYMNLNRGIRPEDVGAEVTNFPGNRVNAHGFNGSIVYNFHRYIGAKFDLTFTSHGEDFASPLQISAPPAPPIAATLKGSQNIQQYLFGIQIKDNKMGGKKFKPWAHILGGYAHQTLLLDETAPSSGNIFDASQGDFAMKFGGGLDWGIQKHVDVRLIQVDWNPIFRSSINVGGRIGTIPGRIENNYSFTWGVALH